MEKRHTFTIAAYKESPYLEECIKSLLNQTVKSNVILCTATPNEYIENICHSYGIEMYVNKKPKGVSGDFNFAYSMADTELVTIAHQDDLYAPNYVEEILKQYEKDNEAIIIYPNYDEIRNGNRVEKNNLLRIKRIMNFPLGFKLLQRVKWVRKLILAFGCPICCSSVTFNKKKITQKEIFDLHFKISPDWNAWVELASIKGSYIYIHKCLVSHRIDEESTTTNGIRTGLRKQEDYEVYCKVWPKWVAKTLIGVYSKAGKSNELK